MSDYISREDALSVFGDIHPLDYSANAYKARIEKMPSADVRENIHGMWIDTAESIDYKYGRHNYVCHKCHEKATCFIGGTEDWWCVDKPNFCPNCGADMRGN